MIIGCIICGKEFRKIANNQTCSLECSKTFKKEQRRKYTEMYNKNLKHEKFLLKQNDIMICKTCGKEFIGIYNNQKCCCSKECSKIYYKESCQTDEFKRQQREYNYKNKLIVIEHYSNGTMKCNCCGENHIEFLTIDHIDCGRQIHNKNKRNNKFTGGSSYRYLIRNNFPEGYQILCFNCNCAKGFFGKCPHELERHNKII